MYKIAEIRKSKGITQKHVAKEAGISQTYLSKIEKGAYDPSGRILFAIADVLGCKVDDLRQKNKF